MRKTFLAVLAIGLAAGVVYAQEYQYIKVMDFEEQTPPTISASWDYETGFSFDEEPHHGGNFSLIMIIYGGTGDWTFSTWQFPTEIGMLDLSNTDEFDIWVYSDNIFQMNFEFGGANLGYRTYNTGDLGSWKKLAWWYPEEIAAGFTEVNSWGSFINPGAWGGFPNGFEGTIFIDDIGARIRKDSPEREYFLVNGFNTEADLGNVTFDENFPGSVGTQNDIAPVEGDGYLINTLSDDGYNRFILDLTNVPEVMDYDRIHFDIYVDGAASGGWGNFDFRLDTTMPAADGTTVTYGTSLVAGSWYTGATEKWREYSGQYGPVADTEGYNHQTLKTGQIAPVYSTEGATVSVRFTSNGGGANDLPVYIDNVRLSRAVGGVGVNDWSLY